MKYVLEKHFPVVIGLVGYAQVGKDSTAAVLVEQGYTRRAFADPLRDLAAYLNPIVGWFNDQAPMRYREACDLYGVEGAKLKVSGVRPFLKQLGTGVRECLDPEAWIRATLDGCPRHTVISDVRFLNEADAIRRRATELGGKPLLLRVDRPGHGPESDFEREVGLIKADLTVSNDGDLDDLHLKVLDLLGDWMVTHAPFFHQATLEGEACC